MSKNKAGREAAPMVAQMTERASQAWRRPAALALALAGWLPGAQAGTELTFQYAPRDFSSDNIGAWSLAYERLVDAQFGLGLVLGLSDIQGPNGRSKGLSAGLRATHYLQPPSNVEQLQPYVGLEASGATHTDRSSSILGALVGVRFPLAPNMDLRSDVLLARRKTNEESLFGSSGTSSSNNIASLRFGISFRY